ncbi:MAG: transcription-repair coupling factor [Chloroflexi bacterium]|nr:transcription-repair coupling factor [Chloroflexota bacterium]
MGLTGLFHVLEGVPGFGRVRGVLREGGVLRLEAPEAAKAAELGALWRSLARPVLVVCPRPEEARRLYEQLLAYCGEDAPIHHFAETEVLPYERMVLDAGTIHQRIRALAALRGLLAVEGFPLVVASAQGMARKTMGPSLLESLCHTLRVGQRVQLEPLLQRWARMGYRLESAAESPGTAARRGGIVDIFPPGAALPARIELWGDVVESIRLFDPGTQRSQAHVQEVGVLPAQEVLPTLADREAVSQRIALLDFSNCPTSAQDRTRDDLARLMVGDGLDGAELYAGFFNDATLEEYLQDGLLVVDEPSELEEAGRDLHTRASELRRAKMDRGEVPGGFSAPYRAWDSVRLWLEGCSPRLEVSRWAGPETESSLALGFAEPPSYWGQLEQFLADARERLRQGQRVVVVSHHSRRLAELMGEKELGVREVEGLEAPPEPGAVYLIRGSAAGGWVLGVDGAPLVLLTDAELFGTAKRAVPARRGQVRREVFLSELVPGSYVVHTDHGVARFAGTNTMAEEGGAREYLVLEYAEGDRLYVPTDHLDRVAPYVGVGDQPPTLTRLGTQEWERAKERVKRSAQKLAEDLLALYAARELSPGHAFSPDAPWQREMEDSFPYVETDDQARAIMEVKADMEQPRPMDRLVCGDVGYGKTEVALRAAFKAVMDGKQVAVLVPTTVLAQQHYATFTDRMGVFPVHVEVLSRFRPESEQKTVVQALKDGGVDIVIGTHRLLQKDVALKDLGLVVVDEEQRFGVGHKERLKAMRKEVDVLTLTATPIPRTLHMALAGVRDMSTMETPPEERLPIKTYVSEYSEDLVREAVLRELDRGGQVFFLHNRVRSIRRVADEVKRLVPQATIGVAHGRMPEEELAMVMEEFTKGHIDVLMCTTIIESGLDIPSANTLIIDRADRLGLAQLYQLRGRIGRRASRGYAYLLIPRGGRITETAKKRLETILAATELGAGFRIAMRDLEIRGAGNILGPEQSGHIHAVGFDLYARLLAAAVEELRAQREGQPAPVREEAAEPRLDLGLPAFIPDHYIPDTATRLSLYQRLARMADPEATRDIAEELRDRFGRPPEEVHNLLYLVRAKALCRRAGVEAATRRDGQLTLRLSQPAGGARGALERALGHGARVGNQQVRLPAADGVEPPWGQVVLEVLDRLAAFRERLSQFVGAGDAPYR